MTMSYLRPLVLFVMASGLNCAVGGLGQLHAAAILEAIPQDNIVQGRNALEKWEQQAATESGVMNIILGNTCFTAAIADMKQGCTKMDSTNRCWLAIQFTVCFQRASGFKPLDCATKCPRYKRLQTCVEDCTSKMDANTYTTYTQFFSDVFNMCLFLQTQNFQEWTAALVQDMHLQTAAANASLGSIKDQLASHHQALQQSLQALADLQSVQQQTAEAAQAGLAEVQAVGQLSAGLQHSMNQSLALTDTMSSQQVKLLQGFSELEHQHQQQAEQALQALQQLAADAAALGERQARYEALQSTLLNASEGLLHQSQGISSLLDLLLHYQQTGSTLLNSLHSSSTTVQDIAFYITALSIPLFFFTHPPEARLLLLLAILLAWVIEKTTMQQIVPLHNAFGSIAGTPGFGGQSPTYFQTVKMVVRMGVMGSGAGLVLWLLFRRQAARNRKEQIFENFRKSFVEGTAFSHAHPMPPQASKVANGHVYMQHMMHTQPGAAAAASPPPPPPPPKTGSKARGRAAAMTSVVRLPTGAAPLTPPAAEQHTFSTWLQHACNDPTILLPHLSHLPTGPAAAAAAAHGMQHPHRIASVHTSLAPAHQQLLPPADAMEAAATAAVPEYPPTKLPPAAVAATPAAADSGVECDDQTYEDEQQREPQQPTASAARSGSQRRGVRNSAAATGGGGTSKGKSQASTGAKRGRANAAVPHGGEGEEEEDGSPSARNQAATGRRSQRRRS